MAICRHIEKVRNSGDYFVCDIIGESLIVMRGEDGLLRAFFNVCAHRASSRLVSEDGCKQRLSCPYHAWAYDTSGQLVRAPNSQHVAGFDMENYQLNQSRVEELHGLIFVNLDPNAATLRDQVPGLCEELQEYAPQLPSMTFAHRTSADFKANWKVAVENYSECYHCTLVHKDFVNGVVDPASYRVSVRGLWQKHLSKARKGADRAYEYQGEGKHVGEFGTWWLWPNFAFQTYPGDMAQTWKWISISETETRVHVDWYLLSSELEDWQREAIDHHARTTFAEDISIVESLQQGLASRSYDTGPLMVDPDGSLMSEHGVQKIQSLWRDAMGAK